MHPKCDLRNNEYLIQFFHECAPTLSYYTRVKFVLILLVSLNNISCFVKCNLYLVFVVDEITIHLHILKQ